ncbi:MAG: hypothetical protein GX115_09635 [Ruminiclostridium sp.]|nr:hypothetical protein [Ruminiclostridium sp.]
MDDKNSLLNFYKEILTIKKRFPEIARGEMTRLDTQNPEICAYTMTWGNRTVLVIHNLSDRELSEDLETLHPGKVKIRGSLLCDSDNSAARIEKGLLTLPPCSTTILQ